MPGRPEDKQRRFAWTPPGEVLKALDQAGEVLYEAPVVSRLTRARAPRVPKVKVAPARELPSYGLPFGVRRHDEKTTCWSCGADVDAVHVAPGYATCPGCGARLPFK